MAHEKSKYSNLYKPGSISEKIDPQKMFYDNIVQSEANYLNLLRRIHSSVGSITELKTIVTSDTTLFTSGIMVLVRGIALYHFEATSSQTADDNKIVAPTLGPGRWFRVDREYLDHINNSGIHVTSAERITWNNKVDAVEGKGLSANDYTNAEKSKLNGISSGANKTSNSTTNGNILIDGVETNVYTHPAGTNPHSTTKADVGLGSVPNVSTNDQTPTYTVATSNANLTSGEKITVAFGKIAKAIASLITHLADSVVHITSAERTAWNGASTDRHTHGNKAVLDNTTASYTTAEKTKLSGIATGANNYTHPSSHPASMITGLPTSLPANGGNSDTVDNFHFVAQTTVPSSLTSNVICLVYE